MLFFQGSAPSVTEIRIEKDSKPMDLETVELTADFHCVTRWSCPDVKWIGFHVDQLKSFVHLKPTARSVMVHSLDGYTTNIPLEYFFDEDVIFAYRLFGSWISLKTYSSEAVFMEKCKVCS